MSELLKTYLLVGVGSAVGGMARFWLSNAVAQRYGETFPWGTLLVNISGSLVIGLLAALNVSEGRFYLQPAQRQFLMIGICGGYTTFSSFSLQTLELIRHDQWLYAAGNILLSVLLCLVAVWIGHGIGHRLNR